jgi:hypothetical protein
MDPFGIVQVQRKWVREAEALGTKSKFWFTDETQKVPWPFKFPQANTGQHWAEKIAAEIAAAMGVIHAKVELAEFESARARLLSHLPEGAGR